MLHMENLNRNESARGKRGSLVSLAGIALNFLLAVAKIVLGIFTSLVSLVADGLNNLSDCGSGAVSLVSFRISQKPADKEHPYGHQRAEYVASMIISFLILLLAAELLRESIGKIADGGLSQGNVFVYVLLGVSVAVKAGMFFLYSVTAKKIGSDTLKAAATDSACDCLATLAVGAGLLLSHYGIAADGYAGLVVALFIAWEGIGVLRDAGTKLLGVAPDPETIEKIRAVILNGEGIIGVHDLRVYRFGRDRYYATAHIEADANLPAAVTHSYLDRVERSVSEETGVELTAHFDPVDLNDSEALELETRIRAAVEGMFEEIDLHDFRLVRGAQIKVIFEAGVPYSCPQKDEEIQKTIERAVRVMGEYEPVVRVERE